MNEQTPDSQVKSTIEFPGFEKPNFTAIPNTFWEFLPMLREAELKVILFAMRKTFGWHKDCDFISLSQFADGTGLAISNVQTAIDKAKTRGLLIELPERGPRGVKLYKVAVNNSLPATGIVNHVTIPATGIDDVFTIPATGNTKQSKEINKERLSPRIRRRHFRPPLIAALLALPPAKTAHEKRLESDPLYAMAGKVWDTNASAILNNITAILRGNSKSKGWSEANITPAVKTDELPQWLAWYKRETQNASVPMQPVKIQYWFDRYRKAQVRKGPAVDPDKMLNLPDYDDPTYWDVVQAELNRINGIAS